MDPNAGVETIKACTDYSGVTAPSYQYKEATEHAICVDRRMAGFPPGNTPAQ